MSEERLEEIKQIRKNMQEFVDFDGYVEDYPRYDEQALFIVDDGHLDWLIEQVERVQELEEQNQGLHIMYDVRLAKFDKLEQQNKRQRKLIKDMAQEIEVLTDIMSNADNADELNEEVIRLKGMRGYENV